MAATVSLGDAHALLCLGSQRSNEHPIIFGRKDSSPQPAASRLLGKGRTASLTWSASPGRRDGSWCCPRGRVPCRAVSTVEEGLVPLGKTSLKVSRIGVGTLQWGDAASGFGERFDTDALAAAYKVLTAGGINFFDTAEVYGYQEIKNGKSSEQLLGRFAEGPGGAGSPPPVLASKFFTIPWTNFLVGGGFRLGRQSMIAALRASLKRLGREKLDLYQIHFPFPTFSQTTLMDGLKEAVELGLTDAVGVSNYSRSQMEEAHALLARSGIPLASNQVNFSLLNRGAETGGLLQACQNLGVQLIAYSPLATGLLTEKALARHDRNAQKVQPLVKAMASIGAQHGGKTVSQVALNYLVVKGAIPIPGCKTEEQARSHVGALGWLLDRDEMESLEGKAAALRL